MRETKGRYNGHELLLEAATHGAVPSDGPGSTSFNSGNSKYANSMEYEEEQDQVLRGDLKTKSRNGRKNTTYLYIYIEREDILLEQTQSVLKQSNLN